MNPTTANRRPRIVRQPRALPTPPADMVYISPCGPPRPDARWHRARLLAEGWEVRDGRDAWVDRAKTKLGYEIPLTRHFYTYVPPRPLEEIDSEIRQLEEEIQELLREVTA